MKSTFPLFLMVVLVLGGCSTVHFDSGTGGNANRAHNECMQSAPMHRVTQANHDTYMQKCMDAQRSRDSGD